MPQNAQPLMDSPILAHELYQQLLNSERCKTANSAQDDCDPAEGFLRAQLHHAAHLESELPALLSDLLPWMREQAQATGRTYQDYLADRHAGAPRRFFRCKSQALFFLSHVAPTKRVDGAWLYGLLTHFEDPRFDPLIRTYLEELGNGKPSQNHVVIYNRLIARQDCEHWQVLGDVHYLQGAIQLALARNASQFLPEILGYNLGYERLPLHLLITAYELRELGIDPHYFTLHVTIDNADSGHAKKAVEAVLKAAPEPGDTDNIDEFTRRVAQGYRLNKLGVGAQEIVDGFDLHTQVISMLANKSRQGRYVHSDRLRIAGRELTHWLSDPAKMSELLRCLQSSGWIKRHQPPRNSRFWRAVRGSGQMAGVFTQYEQQLIFDWIAGDTLADGSDPTLLNAPRRTNIASLEPARSESGVVDANTTPPVAIDQGCELLEQALLREPDVCAQMRLLIPHMSPARHHTAAGLLATRLFAQRF